METKFHISEASLTVGPVQRGCTRGEPPTLCASPRTTPRGYYKRFASIWQALAHLTIREVRSADGDSLERVPAKGFSETEIVLPVYLFGQSSKDSKPEGYSL